MLTVVVGRVIAISIFGLCWYNGLVCVEEGWVAVIWPPYHTVGSLEIHHLPQPCDPRFLRQKPLRRIRILLRRYKINPQDILDLIHRYLQFCQLVKLNVTRMVNFKRSYSTVPYELGQEQDVSGRLSFYFGGDGRKHQQDKTTCYLARKVRCPQTCCSHPS